MHKQVAGQARFGPDVEWVQKVNYAVDPSRGARFYAAIRRYWPALPDGALVSAYSGIRPKTAATGPCDFVIQGPAQTGRGSIGASILEMAFGFTAVLAVSGACYLTALLAMTGEGGAGTARTTVDSGSTRPLHAILSHTLRDLVFGL